MNSTRVKNAKKLDTLTELNRMRLAGELTDVTFVCSAFNGVKLHAHKCMLAASKSSYFRNLFSNNFFEGSSDARVIELSGDHSLEAWKSVLSFIYTAELNMTKKNALALYDLSVYLDLDISLKTIEVYLARNLTVRSCVEVRRLAVLHNNKELLDFTNLFIHQHFTKLIEEPTFLELTATEVKEVLNKEMEVKFHDSVVLKALSLWAANRREQGVQDLLHIMESLGVHKFEREDIMKMQLLHVHPETQDWQRRFLSNPKTEGVRFFSLEYDSNKSKLHFCDYFDNTGGMKELASLPAGNIGTGLAMSKSRIYAVGCSYDCNSVQYYQPNRNVWRSLSTTQESRAHASTVLLNDALYIIGGTSPVTTLYSNTVERLDLVTGISSYQSHKMKKRRAFAGSTVANGCIYVVCGRRPDQRSIQQMERYDPREGIWSQLSCPHFGACSCDAFGDGFGVMRMSGHDISVYSDRMDRWHSVNLPMNLRVSYFKTYRDSFITVGDYNTALFKCCPMCRKVEEFNYYGTLERKLFSAVAGIMYTSTT